MKTVPQRIKEFNTPLLPDMVRIKYEVMAESPFRFFRGTCHLFYEDLHKARPLPASPLVWALGDLHIENFGSYKGANRLVYFDLNDFDESLLAPAAWDLVRMLTSIYVAFNAFKVPGAEATRATQLFLREYAATLTNGRALYIEPQTAKGIVKSFLEVVSGRKQKVLLKERTVKKKGKPVLLIDKQRHFDVDKALKKELSRHIDSWIKRSSVSPDDYEVIDVAFRRAGTGSLGVKRYVFLLKSTKEKNDYFLLDMKQATPSSVRPYLKVRQPGWKSHAERIVAIQQRMQNIPPDHLGVTEFKGDTYVLAEMQPTIDRVDFNLVKDRYKDIAQVIADMAILTASAQLRSSGRQGSAIADKLIAFGADKSWQKPVLTYAHKYAQRVQKDYAVFVDAYKKGYFSAGK